MRPAGSGMLSKLLPLERWRQLATRHGWRLGRFALVGALGVLVNTALLVVLVEVGGLPPVPSGAAATEGAILSNFALNDWWTFRDARPPTSWMERAARYNLVALGGLLLSLVVLAGLIYQVRLHYVIANFTAVAAGFAWNYSANYWFTWSRRPGHGRSTERPRTSRKDPLAPSAGEVTLPWT